MAEKIRSVLELARYEVGTTVWWCVFRMVNKPSEPPSRKNAWMRFEHPKILFERKILTPLWKSKRKLPRLHALDFKLITDLAIQVPIVEDFVIQKIIRTRSTGEFVYSNQYGESMPEKYLFATRAEAVKERARVKKIVREWLDSWE